MNATELNRLLLEAFPELIEKFDECVSWQDGMDTGCFLTFGDLLLPLVRKAAGEGDAGFLDRAGRFVEQLVASGDGYAANVAIVGILEGVKATEDQGAVRPFLGSRSLEIYDDLAWWRAL